MRPPILCGFFNVLTLQDTESFIPGYKEKALQEQIRSLICYLWDNYIQLYDADEIFIMGVGNAYLGVKVLLINRGTPLTISRDMSADTHRLQIKDFWCCQLRHWEPSAGQIRY